MKDIQNREDIEELVDKFYEKVFKDPILSLVFEPSVAHWNEHKIRVYNFWDNWLFQTGSYNGGMMWVHMDRHKTHPLSTDLFEKWLSYWFLTVDECFVGKNAEFTKTKALEIGQILNAKLNTGK